MKFKILRNFAQINIAIILLLSIAIFSILGTVIEQDQTIEYYKIAYRNFYIFNDILAWKFILIFGLNHVYRSGWFLTLLFFFAISLLSCTFTQQFPILKFARRCNFKFNLKDIKNYEYFTTLNFYLFINCLTNFKERKYHIFQQKALIYSYKGILGRFAPIIVHFAMLLILFGNTIGSFTNFNSQELIVKSEIFQIQNLISNNFIAKIPNYVTRINDFWIDYNSTNKIKQFYSDISLVNQKGNEIIHKTISVNFPLRFQNLMFYQTDWNILVLRSQIKAQNYQLPILSLSKSKNIWFTWIPFFLSQQEKGIIFVTNLINNEFSLYNSQGKFLGNFNFSEKKIFKKDLTIFEIVSESGIQIKIDVGLCLIYIGFFVLMLSSLISYFSFTQFWLSKTKTKILIGGTSNRAKLDLRFEFLYITLHY
jgi:cytochrome c biogenesis protein